MQNILVVWESNRSGRAHIYSILFPLYLVAISDKPQHPVAFELLQNFPNPFNPSTTIRFGLSARSHVALSVFNALGQQVAALVNGNLEAGYHDVRFDGGGLASGVYFYRMLSGSFVQTKRLHLLR